MLARRITTVDRLRLLALAVAALAVLLATFAIAAVPEAGAQATVRPLIFVHGVLGSANQFESQSMRFASNGYPLERVVGFDYDSLSIGSTTEAVRDRLDLLIEDQLAVSGASQVDLAGHSLGTSVLQGYLNSSPERAARVAHYVNLDGFAAAAPPGGVPTLAVWGEGNDASELAGAQNVHFPDQTHTQVVTSPETFEVMYEFLTGAPPVSRDIVRQRAGEIQIAGRAHLFPSNEPVTHGDVEIYEVDAATGVRLRPTPDASFPLTDGSWGPFSPDPAAHYEIVVVRDGNGHHHYYEPFVHSSRLMRLLTSEPGTGLDALWERGSGHSNLVLLRNKEWWGDQGPGLDDVLTVNGTDVVTPQTAPLSKRPLAAFVWDIGVDQVTTGDPAAAFAALPFLTGVDIYVPAASPPAGTIAVRSVPRLGNGLVVEINVPNWASDTDRITIQFNDFTTTAAPPDPTTTTTVSIPDPSTPPGDPVPPIAPPILPPAPVPPPVEVEPRLAG